MRKLIIPALLLFGTNDISASTAYGSLGNFDAVNDTGQTCHGFEIEIDDVHSTAIGGTYSWNHYGVPKIREDNSDPAHPKVFVRYEAANPSGTTTGFTNPANPGSISPTNGHLCTNPAVNQGCEHFGVGIYAPASAIKYNWLIKNPAGQIVTGPAVSVGTPTYAYQPPVFVRPPVIQPNPVPNLPPIVIEPAVVQFPAQVVAAIPAPVVPIPAAKQFGEPSWVKVIKTKTHKNRVLALEELVGDDKDNDGHADWSNGEPDEVESEWYLLQTNNKGKSNKSNLAGKADDMGDGREVVTRRYEFYEYVAPAASIDGENGEAMCDAVGPDNISGVGVVTVTDINGNDTEFDCASVAIVGAYRGAQMGEFNAVAPLSLINDIQSGNVGEAFPNRAVVFGGNTPYVTNTSGTLPNGLALDSATGVLSGTPARVGVFSFFIESTDTDGSIVNKNYTIKVTGPGDVDADNDIDSADLAVIKAKYGQNAAAKDPADVNRDLKINILDYRKAASLCTKPQCGL